MSRLRVGVIGVGKMAEICHLPILAGLPQVELAAFCDSSRDNLAARSEQYGVQRRYSDHHALFDGERLDAVCIFVPPFAHTDAEVLAAQRGIHVFVEKPPALSMEKAFEVNTAIEKARIVSAVGFQERYRRAVGAAKERLAGKRPIQGLIHRLHGSRAAAYWWMIEKLSGGAFVENTIHSVDLLRYLAGDFTSVSCRIVERPDKTPELDIPLAHSATFTLAAGGVATVNNCTALGGYSHTQFLLVGGESLFDLSGKKLLINGQEVAEDEPGRAAYEREFATFFDAIIESDPQRVLSPYRDGMRSLAAVLGAVDSARRGGEAVDLTKPPYSAP